MRKLLIAYIKFLTRTTSFNSIRNSFVKDLIQTCFKDKKKYPAYSQLAAYRQALLNNSTSIEVTDLGAKGKVAKTKTRVVSFMAKSAGSTPFRTKLWYRIISHFKPQNILELGTSMGIATHAISLGHKEADITSIEGCPNISAFTANNLKQNGVSNVRILTGDFNEHLTSLSQNSYDLIYFDGNHQKQPTIDYFETMLASAHENTVFIFDDIYWSSGMTEAWDIIKEHPKVTVSIDTFFWGFIFFKPVEQKEQLTIRL